MVYFPFPATGRVEARAQPNLHEQFVRPKRKAISVNKMENIQCKTMRTYFRSLACFML
jgi:hypothetical protein